MLRVLDLFSGIGGFSLGLERTGGFRTVAFCEIEPYCRAVLAGRWHGIPIFDDIRELSATRLREAGIDVDTICGGFPCQDISEAGCRAGIEGSRSGLWADYARLIGELRPRYAIVENVSNLLNRGIERVVGDLAEIGYDAEWEVVSAADMGARHLRERVWIVAYPMRDGRISRRRAEVNLLSQVWNAARFIEQRNRWLDRACQDGETLPDASIRGLEEQRLPAQGEELVADSMWNGRGGENTGRRGSETWSVEPDVGRVAHGVPSRVDRLKALGNAVVPQIPEIIGRAILEAEGMTP